MAGLAAYYPLSPSDHNWFCGLLGVAAASFAVAALASLRREPRSLTFTAAWAAVSVVTILGLASVIALGSVKRGEPTIDLAIQAPLAGYAGRAESFDDYLEAVRGAAQPSEDGRAPTTRRPEDPKAAALQIAISPRESPQLWPLPSLIVSTRVEWAPSWRSLTHFEPSTR